MVTKTSITPESRLTGTNHLDSLTGLRFVAAFFVFMFHVSLSVFEPFTNKGVQKVLSDVFGNGGWVGVSLFFVLSGFVLTWTAKPKLERRQFWRKRLVKIYPMQAATWAISILVIAFPGTTALQAVANLFLVHTWIPIHAFFMSMNSPSWSLCSELLFYLLFPFILPLVRRIPRRYLIAAALAMFATTLLIQLVSLALPAGPQAPEGPISVWRYWLVYYLPLVRLPEFVLGMIACRIVRETQLVRVPLPVAVLLVVGAYALDDFVPFSLSLVSVEMLPIAILICSLARANLSAGTRFLRSRPFQWLGNVSFGFYMSQAPVLIFLRLTVMGGRTYAALAATGVVIGLFATTLALGALLHHYVELPTMKHWSKARVSGRARVEGGS
jgi:peptidoglycan/LPS O-acetylase OafA/YrhL